MSYRCSGHVSLVWLFFLCAAWNSPHAENGVVLAAGDDLIAVSGAGREDAVVSDQIESWGRYECSQLFQQFVGREQEVGGAVGPGRLESERKALGVEDAQSPCRQGRSGDIAAQLLEPASVVGGDASGRMEGESPRREAQGSSSHARGRILEYSTQALAGALAGGDDASHRGGGDGGENRCTKVTEPHRPRDIPAPEPVSGTSGRRLAKRPSER